MKIKNVKNIIFRNAWECLENFFFFLSQRVSNLNKNGGSDRIHNIDHIDILLIKLANEKLVQNTSEIEGDE